MLVALLDRRAQLALLNLDVLQVTEDVAGRRTCCRCAGAIDVVLDQAGAIAQILVVAALRVQEVGLGLVIAGHGGRLGVQYRPAPAIELVEFYPVIAAGHVVEYRQDHLADVVTVDDVLIVVRQRLDGLVGPVTPTIGVGAGAVGEGERALAAGATRAAFTLHGLGRDPLGGIVDEVIVGIRGDLRVGGRRWVGEGRRQPGIGLRLEDVLQCVRIAAALGGVVTIVTRVQRVARAVLDDPLHQVSDITVRLGAVVICIIHLANGSIGACAHLPS